MNTRIYIRNNLVSISIVIFLAVFGVIQYYKPGFIYNRDGSLRDFGLNNTRKTIFPIWLVTIIVAVLSYVGVLYYLAFPKIQY
jgi:hypothetical protein